MPERPNVMVSSTVMDLPEHRKQIGDACLRMGMFPLMMEHRPSSDADAIACSIALVDNANIYLGVFANRYGYVPAGHAISITEMEYNRAVGREIPRLIFIMDKDHPIRIADVEMGEPAVKLQAFKDRVGVANVTNPFKSPDDLRALVIQSLSQHRQPDLTVFHYVSDIPKPPEEYIAHPYTLLQSKGLIGRHAELNLLTDWVSKPSAEVFAARILNVVAIGGTGKSALTWKWFNDIAPQEMNPLAGRMWWSFYESDAGFENFVTRCLAYVTRRPRQEVEKILPPDRERELLAALDREPFLIVLDGLERILIAYARMDAARLSDDDLDAKSAAGRSLLRKTVDPRAGSFLRKLAAVRASRILVSTRLYPADLQTATRQPAPGCSECNLSGMSDDDALSFWREFKVTGTRKDLLRLFHTFESHPLLIQSLAAEVANFRPAPGDFVRWQAAHRDFDPFSLPLTQVKSHVLAFALQGLDKSANKLLHTIAAFRMPATYDTLAALTVGGGKLFMGENALDAVLTELEDRGLVGWDKRANRYDSHPIVRGVAWTGLGKAAQQNIYSGFQTHFESLPYKKNWREVSSLEELTGAIELYNTLMGLGRYDAAVTVFRERFSHAALYGLNASYQAVELLEMLFPDGSDGLPSLTSPSEQGATLYSLAQHYDLSGRPTRAIPLYLRSLAIAEKLSDRSNLGAVLNSLSVPMRLVGKLRDSEANASRAFLVGVSLNDKASQSVGLCCIGFVLATRGFFSGSNKALNRSLKLSLESDAHDPYEYLAFGALLFEHYDEAQSWADRAIAYCEPTRYTRGLIRAFGRRGMAALGLGRLAAADEDLHRALTQARTVNLVEEELPALVGLSELRRREGDPKAARELLDDIWESAERGPYPLFHADALNVLAQIESDAGNRPAAVEAATKAYRLAWCDGPPYAYHRGLETAKKHLAELAAPEPTGLPPFDESKFEPMPEVEID